MSSLPRRYAGADADIQNWHYLKAQSFHLLIERPLANYLLEMDGGTELEEFRLDGRANIIMLGSPPNTAMWSSKGPSQRKDCSNSHTACDSDKRRAMLKFA